MSVAPPTVAHMNSDDVLRRVRKLLAVAEHPGTPPEEADAAAQAAERLIAKHAIDQALLESGSPNRTAPESRSIVVDPPYAGTKATLAGAIADAHGVRAITIRSPGAAMRLVLVGFPSDLALVDLLYTSLLLQATSAMRRENDSGRGFRRAFLIGFAIEVGERLKAAREEAIESAGETSTALVLRDRARDVEDEVRRQFPRLRTTRTTLSDRAGLVAGRRSGASADLSSNSRLGRSSGQICG
jgi:Protein of unknown function (DUF2786)